MTPPTASPNPKIYGPIVRLVPITVLGRTYEVPDDIPLIRAFQYIQFELDGMRCDWSLFCFNDTIGCCNTRIATPTCNAQLERACCLRVRPDLVVTELPKGCQLHTPDDPEPTP